MPMNTVIREKRKEMGLTQEQVAEYLGVSAPAVHKWEKGATYPDITLLPALARLLKIDPNTLLCFHEGLSEQEIGHFCKNVLEEIRKNGFEQGFAMLNEKIREYPNHGALIHTSALLMEGALLLYGTDPGEREKYADRITELFERALKCDDAKIRNKATFMLASRYTGRSEYDKAQEMLDLLPDHDNLDKRGLQANLWIKQGKLPEAEKLLEQKLWLTEIQEIQSLLILLTEIAVQEGRDQDASRIAEISRETVRLLGLWDYSAHIAPLTVALSRKDAGESLSILKSMLAALKTPWDPAKSPLFRLLPTRGFHAETGSQMLPAILSELENDPKYEFLRAEPDFQRLIEECRAK